MLDVQLTEAQEFIPSEAVGVGSSDKKLRPQIVVRDDPERATFGFMADERIGPSNVNSCVNVPTADAIVMRDCDCSRERIPATQTIKEFEVQLTVWQVIDRAPVGVRSERPKLTPAIVTSAPPLVAKFNLSDMDRTGTSKLNTAGAVPTAEATVTTISDGLPAPSPLRQAIDEAEVQEAVSIDMMLSCEVIVLSDARKFKPETVVDVPLEDGALAVERPVITGVSKVNALINVPTCEPIVEIRVLKLLRPLSRQATRVDVVHDVVLHRAAIE